MLYSKDGSSDEYETDENHPSDNESEVKFLRGGKLARSPERPRGTRVVRRASPRRAARVNNSGSGNNGNSKPGSGGRSGGNAGSNGGNKRAVATNSRTGTRNTKAAKPKSSDDDSYAGDDSDYETDNERPTTSTKPNKSANKGNGKSASKKAKYAIGTTVSKQFNDVLYSGKVTQYHAQEGHYTIHYEDGDEEDVSEDELEKLLHDNEGMEGLDENGGDSDYKSKNVSRELDGSGDDSAGKESDSDEDNFFSGLNYNKNKKKRVVESFDSDSSDSEVYEPKLTAKKQVTKRSCLSDSENSDDGYFNTTSGKKNGAKRGLQKRSSNELLDSDSDLDISPKKPAAKKLPARKSTSAYSSDDSFKRDYKNPSPKKRSPPKSTAATAAAATRNTQSKTVTKHDPAIRADSEKGLQKAKEAREALRQAQKYKAEELEVVIPEYKVAGREVYELDDSSVEALPKPCVVSTARAATTTAARRAVATTATTATTTTNAYTGPLLHLTLRYKASNKTTETTLRIKSDEPLKFLQDRFSGGTITCLEFDGQKLDLNKTPVFYDMEDEDLIDATVAQTNNEIVKLLVQKSETCSHEFGMSKSAPLSKLISAVCDKFKVPSVVLKYNGRELNPTKSCVEEDIFNHARIDAICGGAVSSISLEFRVNGNEREMHSVSVLGSGTFGTAMEKFTNKAKCNIADCKFEFDGEILQSHTSIESLDLEGGEIIDVKLTQSKPSAVVNRLPAVTLNKGANPPPLRDEDGDVVMLDMESVAISIKTVRNLAKTKPKTWKLSNTDPITALKNDYIDYYKSKGCKSVQFYFNNACLVESKTFAELGIGDGEKIYAMENGKKYK